MKNIYKIKMIISELVFDSISDSSAIDSIYSSVRNSINYLLNYLLRNTFAHNTQFSVGNKILRRSIDSIRELNENFTKN
jgi:translation elongation factor EF-4